MALIETSDLLDKGIRTSAYFHIKSIVSTITPVDPISAAVNYIKENVPSSSQLENLYRQREQIFSSIDDLHKRLEKVSQQILQEELKKVSQEIYRKTAPMSERMAVARREAEHRAGDRSDPAAHQQETRREPGHGDER